MVINTKGLRKECFAILPNTLLQHLTSRGMQIPVDIIANLKDAFPGQCKSGIQKVFFAQDSSLKYIPSGRKARSGKCKDAVYCRAVYVHKSAFSDTVQHTLQEGTSDVQLYDAPWY